MKEKAKILDKEAIENAAKETGIILTAEEHQKGGMGDKVSSVIMESAKCYGHNCLLDMVGVDDRFGESGQSWELIKEFKLSAEHIAVKAKKLYDMKSKKKK